MRFLSSFLQSALELKARVILVGTARHSSRLYSSIFAPSDMLVDRKCTYPVSSIQFVLSFEIKHDLSWQIKNCDSEWPQLLEEMHWFVRERGGMQSFLRGELFCDGWVGISVQSVGYNRLRSRRAKKKNTVCAVCVCFPRKTFSRAAAIKWAKVLDQLCVTMVNGTTS